MKRRLSMMLGLIAAPLLTGCFDEDYSLSVSVGPWPTSSALPIGYQVGDTVEFIAVEMVSAKVGSSYTSSASPINQSYYRWSTSNGAVAKLIAPGRFVMAQLGHDSIAVETDHVRRVFRVLVVPRVASLRISPTTATVSIGETVTMDVDPLDANGAVISSIKTTPLMVEARPDPSGSSYPVLVERSDAPPFVLRAINIGTGRVPVSLSVYRTAAVRDTAVIIVR